MGHSDLAINQLYDSHVHWLATGDVAIGLSLNGLNSIQQLKSLQIQKSFFRGEWLYAFGWDENNFDATLKLNLKILDSIFYEYPVLFSRADGHSSWVNSMALLKLNFIDKNGQLIENEFSSFIEKDSSGLPTGVLHEKAHMKALFSLPSFNKFEIKERLLVAQALFLSQGFTHIRDMTSDENLWEAACELENEDKLKIHAELNFSCEDKKDFERAFRILTQVYNQKTTHLKPRGIKIFFDGSLGSQRP